jgi:hypothetical protein
MPSPPVYHPRDPDHERRVKWGLALVTIGTLVALIPGYIEQILWSSAFCYLNDCAVPSGERVVTTSYSVTLTLVAQWVAYVASTAFVAGVTVWWWSGRSDPRSVVAAEFCALFALSGWWFVVPAAPHGWLFLLVGGFLTALGTGGLFARDDHDAAAFTARIAAGGGVLFWTGLTLASLMGTAPLWAPLTYSPLFVGFLLLCAGPLSWLRTHVLFALSMLVLGLQPWEPLADPTGASDIVTTTPEPAAPLEAFAPLADVAMLVFVGFAILAVLTAVVLEFAFQLSPSMAHRVVDEVPG